MARLRFRVPEHHAGARLDRVLAVRPGARLARARRAPDRDGRRARRRRAAGEELPARGRGGDRRRDPRGGASCRPEELDIPIVWEDEHLLVVDKPAGLVVHPAGSTRTGTLVQGLLALGAEGGDDDDRPGIVHRLDRDTSGPARRRPLGGGVRAAAGADPLARARAHLRRARPRHAAVAHRAGSRRRSAATAATARATRSTRRRRAKRSPGSRSRRRCATTRSSTCGSRPGRTHQIRVHLEAIELPVSGDPVYGVAGDLGLERQFLHAHRLRFEHPVTRAEIDVELASCRADLAAALALARG